MPSIETLPYLLKELKLPAIKTHWAEYNAPLKSDQKKIFFSYKTIIFIMIFATRNLKNETVCKKI